MRDVTRRHALLAGTSALLLAAAAACRPGGTATAPSEQAPGPSKGPVTLRYLHAWSELQVETLDRLMADFRAKNPTIQTEQGRLAAGPGALAAELARLLAAGTPPDVAMLWRGSMPGFAAKGGLLALDPFMRRDKFDTRIYYDGEVRTSQFLGQTYVLPGAAAGAWYLLFYNRDHFREAGLDESKPPETWDDAIRMARQVQKAGIDGKIERLGFEPGFKSADLYTSPFTCWLMTNYGKYASDDGRKLLFDSAEGRAALDWMNEVVIRMGGREALEEYVTRTKGGHDSFPIGQRAMYMTNHSFPMRLRTVAKDLRYGIGLLPRGSARGAQGMVRGGWSNGIPADVPAPHESWLLTHFLSATPEGGGAFMQAQVRPSPIRSVNEAASYNELPHWDMIKKGLASDRFAPATPIDPDIDKLTAAAMTDVYNGKQSTRDALQAAQREGQRLLDEFWAGLK
jgi:multiple sugar transport system substrate-binding protein